MWELIFSFLAIIYLLTAFRLFYAWLKLLNQDSNYSSVKKSQGIAILIVIAIFWPLFLPFTYLELLNKGHWENQPVENKPEIYVTPNRIVVFYEQMKL